MKTKIATIVIALFSFFTYSADDSAAVFYKAIHLMAPSPKELPLVNKMIKEIFAPAGVNMIIFEIDYRFKWKTHPELAGDNPFTEEQIKELVAVCRDSKIRLVPLFNCLGHQSWKSYNAPLLVKYPQFDETPNLPKDNPGIYCRSWCPSNPDLLPIIKDLFTELKAAFEADAIHAGMDEVFILASDDCPRCKGKNTAELFAKAVNDLHNIIVRDLKMEMMIWGDRLLDDAKFKYGKWESSQNGTAPAIDKIPQDIIICDWHYELRNSYPSIDYFISKKFRVMPSSWKNEKAALAFLNYANNFRTNSKLYGHLCTTWCSSGNLAKALSGEGEQSREVMEIATTTKTMLMKIPVSRK
jgi:thiol-disulfide isomerase/thioredoxin